MSVFAFDIRAKGSPPHTRGKDTRRRLFFTITQDHPRTRGEKAQSERLGWTMAGSPPHTRGKGNCFKTRIITLRITPAHAGKSKLSVFLVIFFPGSPPHTRGKAVERIGAVVRAGITPAHAGKRGTAGRCISPLPDHPRTRGEKSQIIGKNSAKSGSPPHTRGKGGRLCDL